MLKKLILSFAVCSMAGVGASADATDAASRGALFTQRVVCVPLTLVALDGSAKKGFSLDLDKAATQLGAGSTQRSYEFSDTDFRVAFSMKYSEKQIEISKLFSQMQLEVPAKTKGKGKGKGKGKVVVKDPTTKTEKIMMSFFTPWTIDLPMPAGTVFVLKSDATDEGIPAFDVECQLERVRIDNDCSDCN